MKDMKTCKGIKIPDFYIKLFQKAKSVNRCLKFSFLIAWKASAGNFILRVVFEMIGVVVPVVAAYISKEIIDLLVTTAQNGNVEQGIYRLVKLIAITLAIQFFSSLFQRINEISSNMHRDLVSNYLNMQILKKSASLDLSFFDSPVFQNEIMNARRDSQSLQSLAWIPITVIRSAVQIFITIPILCKLHWAFPVLLILLKVPSMIVEKKFTYFTYNWTRNRVPEERKMGYIQTVLTSKAFAKDLRLFNLFDNILDRYVFLWKKWFSEKLDISYKRGKWVALCSTLPQVGSAGIALYLGIEIILRRLSIGDYSFYGGISGQAIGAINALVNAIVQTYDSELKISNYMNFLDWKTCIVEDGSLEPPGHPEIEFRNVSFKYPDTEKDILKNLSFRICKGEKIAAVGLNGAGKSTIVKLLLRFYDPTEGQILFDGVDIRQYDLQKLRTLFTAVFQDYALYSFTARENITMSDMEAADNDLRVEEACDISGVDQLRKKWKNGLESYLTKYFEEDGEELSGGEWQKIAIARGFFRKTAKIIILDEPSSALDAETEHRMFQRFLEICDGRTAFFISHRLSSVTMADKILVLEEGRVIEEGTHEELIKKEGRYAYLFNLQAQAYRK